MAAIRGEARHPALDRLACPSTALASLRVVQLGTRLQCRQFTGARAAPAWRSSVHNRRESPAATIAAIRDLVLKNETMSIVLIGATGNIRTSPRR